MAAIGRMNSGYARTTISRRCNPTEIRALGHCYGFVPFGYAAGQVLATAVTQTKSLDHDKLADYIRSHSFQTVVGEIT
jgi:hypothetical protein